jgi:hypothetical protein
MYKAMFVNFHQQFVLKTSGKELKPYKWQASYKDSQRSKYIEAPYNIPAYSKVVV